MWVLSGQCLDKGLHRHLSPWRANVYRTCSNREKKLQGKKGLHHFCVWFNDYAFLIYLNMSEEILLIMFTLPFDMIILCQNVIVVKITPRNSSGCDCANYWKLAKVPILTARNTEYIKGTGRAKPCTVTSKQIPVGRVPDADLPRSNPVVLHRLPDHPAHSCSWWCPHYCDRQFPGIPFLHQHQDRREPHAKSNPLELHFFSHHHSVDGGWSQKAFDLEPVFALEFGWLQRPVGLWLFVSEGVHLYVLCVQFTDWELVHYRTKPTLRLLRENMIVRNLDNRKRIIMPVSDSQWIQKFWLENSPQSLRSDNLINKSG